MAEMHAGLEQLQRAYGDRGFLVLGFPCDQFAGQEPGEEAEIQQFCSLTYGVTFPLFKKIKVNGPHADPLYRILKARRRGPFGLSRILWNFTKFLVSREGEVLERFGPKYAPEAIEPHVADALFSATQQQE